MSMTKESVGKESAHDDQEDEGKGGVLGSNKRWKLSRLREVHGRRYMLRPSAIELFFVDMSLSLFINFQPNVQRDAFYSKLRSSRCLVPLLRSPKTLAPRTVFHRSNLTELWRQRRISNFDYIMQLNIMAGRSFNDIGQYPVFPWVLADYESQSLDLNDSRTFRDLTKPVGALNPDRLAQLIERYNSLDGFPEEQKFLYGSHYSSPGFVLYYLIRQEPFTSMHITLQSGRFDVADRLFYSIAETWKSCLTSTSDVKELIPEFYTCPEIFLNTNDFDLGTTQSKIKVHDVQLPPWAKGSAHEFVRLHRLALESDYVSKNLHHWVDLIFGYQQRGEEAAKAHNIFHYLSYEGAVDIEKISDDIDKNAIESHVANFGQCPSQILTKQPHPPRHPRPSWRPICQELSKLKALRVFTPKKQFGGYQGSEANGAVLSIHPMSSCCVVIYGDLSIGTYRWAATSSGNRSASSFSFKMQSLRTLGSRKMTLNGEVFNAIYPLSASLATRKDEFADRNGRLSMGNWSFAVLLGGAAKDAQRRRQASSRTKVGEVPLSTLEASSYIISSGYVDNSIKCHTLDTLQQKDSSDGGHRSGGINCISADDEEFICTGGVDGTVRVFVAGHDEVSQALADGYVKTSSSSASSSTATSKIVQLVHVCFGHQAPITCISVSSDLDVVVSGSQDGTICVHSLRRGRYLRKIHARHFYLQKKYYDATRAQKSVGIRKIALDRHGKIIVHLNDGMLHSYSVNDAVLCGADAGEKLNCMKLCADGEVLVTGGESSHVVIRQTWDLSVRCVLDLTSHGPITDIALTPSSSDSAHQYILIGTSDGRVTVIGENNTEEDDDRSESGMAYLDAN